MIDPFALPAAQVRPGRLRPWHWLALALILLLAAGLRLYNLGQEGYGNLYYAAAVRSMLTGWRNFFFVSFDPAGFVSVDKPPLGLWVQAASAWLFGFQGWDLLLPQALAGVFSVALVFWLVARRFGAAAGLLAALVLALTPIAVAADRNNTMDSLLVFTLLLAAWAALLAIERGQLRWLLLCAALLGVGFNIKMLQAYLVLPAFFLTYLLVAPPAWWKRLLHLALAGFLLVVVSLSWAVFVDLMPASARASPVTPLACRLEFSRLAPGNHPNLATGPRFPDNPFNPETSHPPPAPLCSLASSLSPAARPRNGLASLCRAPRLARARSAPHRPAVPAWATRPGMPACCASSTASLPGRSPGCCRWPCSACSPPPGRSRCAGPGVPVTNPCCSGRSGYCRWRCSSVLPACFIAITWR